MNTQQHFEPFQNSSNHNLGDAIVSKYINKKPLQNFRLFEFGDLSFMPEWYHVALRSFLVVFYKIYRYHSLWVKPFEFFINKQKTNTFLECCSGAGDCLPMLHKLSLDEKTKKSNFILSDLKPCHFSVIFNKKVNSQFHYYEKPVDATSLPTNLKAPLIFINSFHHLNKPIAKQTIQNALKEKNGVLILEYVNFNLIHIFSMIFGALSTFLLIPLVLRGKNLLWTSLFTYVIPIFPIMIMWDGIISCINSYSFKEIKQMIENQNKVELHYHFKRSFLYPAGVTAISILPSAENLDNDR